MKKQKEDQEELKRKDSKKASLIIYGIPENKTDAIEQMKADFNALKQLYADRVTIESKDISYISRLGDKNPDQIRPIKITCTSMDIRKEILTKNLGLKIEEGDFDMCNCKPPGNHVHIYITTDKTKQEQELEKS